MRAKKKSEPNAVDLRKRAEEVDRDKIKQTPDMTGKISLEAAQRLVQELRVHQIELEMQNEELQRAEAQLKISRTRYFELYDLAPVGYLMINEKGLIVEANLTLACMLGVGKNNLIDHPFSKFVFPQDADINYLYSKQLFETGTSQVIELRLVKQDGVPFWVRLETNLAWDTKRTPYVRAVVSDISQRKLAEEELKASREQYRTLTENIKEVIWVLDVETLYFLYVSPSEYLLRGYTSEEAMAAPLDAVLPEEKRDIVKSSILQRREEVLAGRLGQDQYFDEEMEVLHKNGTRIWIRVSYSFYLNKGTGHVEARGLSRDISERKQAAELLQAREEDLKEFNRKLIESGRVVQQEKDRLLSLINSISDEVWFADTEKQFTLANPSALQEFQIGSIVSSVEGLANSLEVFRSDGSLRPIEEAPPLRALKGESVRNQQEIIRTPATGELRYREVNANPVRDTEGNIVGSVSVVRDITERKRAEEELQASQNRYRALMEQSFEALALIDIETQEVVEVNRRFTELLGYSLPEDAPLYSNKYAVDAQSKLDSAHEAIQKGRFILPTESRVYRHKNGQVVHAERAGTAIFISGKNYLLSSMRDMTAERRRQAEMSMDVEIARRVQRGLLPELPESPLVTIRTLYHPSNFVSGDTYHMEWLKEGKLLRAFLLDVSGHGLATALQTTSINVLLRETTTSNLSLIAQLRLVNAKAAKYFIDGAYAAILAFELDFNDRKLRYAGAGITQFYANGKKIVSPGMFVGIWDKARFVRGSLPIMPGDTFHFLTDGFTDWLGRPENSDFLSPNGKDFETDVAALEQLGESGKLRDDATGVCLKITEFLEEHRVRDRRETKMRTK